MQVLNDAEPIRIYMLKKLTFLIEGYLLCVFRAACLLHIEPSNVFLHNMTGNFNNSNVLLVPIAPLRLWRSKINDPRKS